MTDTTTQRTRSRHTAGALRHPQHHRRPARHLRLILTLAGIFGDAEEDKTGGVNANLWAGLALIAAGVSSSPGRGCGPWSCPTTSSRPTTRSGRRVTEPQRRWINPAPPPGGPPAAPLAGIGDEAGLAWRRQEADHVHHVPVRRRLAPAPGDVQMGEAVGDAGAVMDRQVGAAVRHVEPRRTPRGLDPVDHPADPVVLPEHVAQVEVAVQERRLVRRRVAAEDRERLLPRAGMPRPLRHDVLGRPRPRLVVARRGRRDDRVDRDEQVGELPRSSAPTRSRSTRPGSRLIRWAGCPAVDPSASRARLVGAGTTVSASSRWISLSRVVNPAPWVRHGSWIISRSTARRASCVVSASMAEVQPPSSGSAETSGLPRAAAAQAKPAPSPGSPLASPSGTVSAAARRPRRRCAR